MANDESSNIGEASACGSQRIVMVSTETEENGNERKQRRNGIIMYNMKNLSAANGSLSNNGGGQ